MNKATIHTSIDELTQKVIVELENAIEQTNATVCNVALSGGSTPKAIFRQIAKHYKDKLDWSKLAFFWVDERCVPHASSESNYGEAYRMLFQHINARTYPVDGDNNPASEAQRYGNLISNYLKTQDGFPVFNLILLGIGTDGHTASIFPNQIKLLNTTKPCAVASHPDSGQKRISLTGKTILNAERIIFIATGKDKQKVVKEVLAQNGNYRNYPAWHIAHSHPNCEWLLDNESSPDRDI